MIERAGREVTVVGLGTRGLSGALRDVAPEDAARAVPAAIELGITLIDVSPQWSDSLVVTGAAVRDLRARDRVCVACSVPPLGARGLAAATAAALEAVGDAVGSRIIVGGGTGTLRVTAPAAAGGIGRVMPPAYVQRSVEDSLRALRLDALPLAWIGGWRDAWLDDRMWPELLGTLHRLVREGKVLAWGVTAPDGAPEEAVRAAAEPWPAAISVRHSLFDRSALETLAPVAATNKVALIAREPLARGALGGELAPSRHFPPEDERNDIPRERLAAMIPELARLAALVTHTPPAAASTEAGRVVLEQMRRGDDVEIPTVAELALRAAIDPAASPGVTAAVVGCRRVPHVAVALGCADGIPLHAGLRAALDARRWGEGWYAAP